MTISYGPWPNEVLLQQWGFVPEFNPYDAVALFDNFEDLLCQIAACNTGTGMLREPQSISGGVPGKTFVAPCAGRLSCGSKSDFGAHEESGCGPDG